MDRPSIEYRVPERLEHVFGCIGVEPSPVSAECRMGVGRRMSGPGLVYVLTDGTAHKIGVTGGDVEKRIAELQTGNPRRIRPVLSWMSPDPYYDEGVVQVFFEEKKVLNEWYDLDADDLVLLRHVAEFGCSEDERSGL